MCPPASMPSMISASAPARTRRLATARLGAKHSSLAPPSLTRARVARSGRPPASTTWVTRCAPHTSISCSSRGCMMIRLTPNGRVVSACVAAISAASWSGSMAPHASTPKPPAFDSAATRRRSETQVIAPPISASGLPKNAVPARHRCSRRRRPRTSVVRRRRGHRRCAARAVPARCRLHRSIR